jgi:hypothetical protein
MQSDFDYPGGLRLGPDELPHDIAGDIAPPHCLLRWAARSGGRLEWGNRVLGAKVVLRLWETLSPHIVHHCVYSSLAYCLRFAMCCFPLVDLAGAGVCCGRLAGLMEGQVPMRSTATIQARRLRDAHRSNVTQWAQALRSGRQSAAPYGMALPSWALAAAEPSTIVE